MTSNAYEIPSHKMNVDEFLEWSKTVPGRFELHHGYIYQMQAERLVHAIVKNNVWHALREAARRDAPHCTAVGDGTLVKCDDGGSYIPDALLQCDEVGMEAVHSRPVIVVEVISPSTERHDWTSKMAGYWRAGFIEHYLIVNPIERSILHMQRVADAETPRWSTTINPASPLQLSPPGISLDLTNFFDDIPTLDEAQERRNEEPK